MAKVPMVEMGVSGLQRSGGTIEEEFNRNLKGTRWSKVVAQMTENDPVVGAVLLAINLLIGQVGWRVVAGSDDAQDVAAAEFVGECLHDMSRDFTTIISEILTMIPWGWAYLEIVYKTRNGPTQKDTSRRSKYSDGRIGWRKFALRGQNTLDEWIFDEHGNVQGMWQSDPNGGPRRPLYLTDSSGINKCILFRTTSNKGNPEGRSLLRSAYRPWYFKTNFENIMGIGVERDLAGLPVAFVPAEILDANAGPAEQAVLTAVKDIVTSIRRDEQEGIVFPMVYDESGRPLYDLKLLSSGGSRQFDILETLRYYDQRIAMAMLADFLTLGHDGVGSYALSSNKTELFTTALGAWMDIIGGVSDDGRPLGVMNQHAIPSLLKANNLSVKSAPMLVHDDIDQVDLGQLGALIGQLAGAGAMLFPNDDLEAYFLQRAGLPVTERD
jgi:hypothetical protein